MAVAVFVFFLTSIWLLSVCGVRCVTKTICFNINDFNFCWWAIFIFFLVYTMTIFYFRGRFLLNDLINQKREKNFRCWCCCYLHSSLIQCQFQSLIKILIECKEDLWEDEYFKFNFCRCFKRFEFIYGEEKNNWSVFSCNHSQELCGGVQFIPLEN